MKKALALILIMILIYCSAYDVARWRKIIVMQEYHLKEESLLIRETGPGWDLRDNWKGRLKNKLNGPIFIFFRPLEIIENQLRGFRKPLPLISN